MLKIFRKLNEPKADWALKFHDNVNVALCAGLAIYKRAEQPDLANAVFGREIGKVIAEELLNFCTREHRLPLHESIGSKNESNKRSRFLGIQEFGVAIAPQLLRYFHSRRLQAVIK